MMIQFSAARSPLSPSLLTLIAVTGHKSVTYNRQQLSNNRGCSLGGSFPDNFPASLFLLAFGSSRNRLSLTRVGDGVNNVMPVIV